MASTPQSRLNTTWRGDHGETSLSESPGFVSIAPFDPLSDLLVAQKVRPAHLTDVNLRTLTPFQRSLLAIDGTVTKLIEAHTMEPVDVVLLEQKEKQLAEDHAWLEAPSGTSVIARQVLLRGRYSYALYAYAVSLLVFHRLSSAIRSDLKKNPGGLGRILLEHQLETRREVLWYGREQLRQVPTAIEPLANGGFISRTYRIIAEGQPLMLINEKFPCQTGQHLDHH